MIGVTLFAVALNTDFLIRQENDLAQYWLKKSSASILLATNTSWKLVLHWDDALECAKSFSKNMPYFTLGIRKSEMAVLPLRTEINKGENYAESM